jgi:hypothetical protein
MKDITIALDEEVYRKACLAAEQKGTSVPDLIAGLLRDYSQESGELERIAEVRSNLMTKLLNSSRGFGVGPRPTREEMHER